MKILVIPAWFPSNSKPHYVKWIIPHIKMLKDHGHDVFVIHIDFDTDCTQTQIEDEPGIRRVIVRERHPQRLQRVGFVYRNHLRIFQKYLDHHYHEIVSRWGVPDILHAHTSMPAGFCAARLARRIKKPVIVTEHFSGVHSDIKYPWRLKKYYRQTSEIAHGIYAVSPSLHSKMTGKKIHMDGCLPNPIDTDFFCRQALAKQDKKVFNIVSIGNVSMRKGTDVLLQALNNLDSEIPWFCTIIGDDTHLNYFRRFIRPELLRSRFKFTGLVSQHMIRTYNQNADVCVVASRRETANVSMLEALACGTPVIATRCGGPESLLDDTVSLIIEPEDTQALVQALTSMYSSEASKYNADTNRKYVLDRYSIEAVYAKTLQVYQRAIEQVAEDDTYE